MTTYTDRYGNAVPFSPYTDDTLARWQQVIASDVMISVGLGHPNATMSSVFGSGQCVPVQVVARLGLDVSDANNARVLGNERIYGPAPWEVAS